MTCGPEANGYAQSDRCDVPIRRCIGLNFCTDDSASNVAAKRSSEDRANRYKVEFSQYLPRRWGISPPGCQEAWCRYVALSQCRRLRSNRQPCGSPAARGPSCACPMRSGLLFRCVAACQCPPDRRASSVCPRHGATRSGAPANQRAPLEVFQPTGVSRRRGVQNSNKSIKSSKPWAILGHSGDRVGPVAPPLAVATGSVIAPLRVEAVSCGS